VDAKGGSDLRLRMHLMRGRRAAHGWLSHGCDLEHSVVYSGVKQLRRFCCERTVAKQDCMQCSKLSQVYTELRRESDTIS
jgi:hypothetical protein